MSDQGRVITGTFQKSGRMSVADERKPGSKTMRLIRKEYLRKNASGLSRRELWRKCYSLAGCTPKQQDAETVGEVFIERQDFGLKAVLCLPTLLPSPPVGICPSSTKIDVVLASDGDEMHRSSLLNENQNSKSSLKYLLQTFC